MLTLLPPAMLATAPEFRVEEGTLKITIQDEKKKEKTRKKKDEKSEKDDDEKNKKSKHKKDDDDDDEGEDGGKPAITLLTGTYDPRLASYGTLRQYTLSSQGLFADYLKGNGPTKAEVIGVGMNGGALFSRSSKAAISPFLNWGWGVYHSRGNSSETKLAWRLGMGITTQVGFVAKLQLLDTKLNNGNLRGSSLMFGWRF
ncbi:hypothetical protein [Armatimonas sp.]|uniref:hypothetical protein n=1 Tax=Armatimonas sp. TaxID=1872638 RepID=UPI00286A4E9B|nr:hypothetical protein [Armatimonas sp.]